jgi:hypothetical protein
MTRSIAIDPTTADVLSRATVDENVLTLPGETLERKVYQDVNKVLEALGGKWNRKLRGHVFDDASTLASRLAGVLDDGKVAPADAMGYFPTPRTLAQHVVDLACIEPQHAVLEPSAGQGAIADVLDVPVDQIQLVEVQQRHADVLTSKGYPRVLVEDFMAAELPLFDRVVMNPPFERKQDVDHVTRAFGLLKPGGRLVAVMSAGATANKDRKSAAFQLLLAEHGWHEKNPDGAFKESGTGVHTVTVVLDAAASAKEDRS